MTEIELNYKLLFLGETSVGKTSLLLRYTENKFDSSLPTVGVDVKYKYLTYENKKIRLEIWDTAGQERFRGIAKNYFRGAHAVIFVFDITNKDSFNKLKAWMNDAKQNINDFTELVIAENKIDLEEKRNVTKELIKEFGEKNNLEIFATSAKSGEGINEIFSHLVSKLFLNKKIGNIEEDDEYSHRKNSITIDGQKGNKERDKERCSC